MCIPRLFALALLGLAACSPGVNDVSTGRQAADEQALLERQAALGGRVVPQNAAQAPVNSVTRPGGTIATGGSTFPTGAAAAADVTFQPADPIAARAESAIAAAENGPPQGGDTSIFTAAPEEGTGQPRPLIPRVAAFALRTTHVPGDRQWRRNPLRRSFQIGCETFTDPDAAQDRFLAEGGPERDPFGMDPDGDGFVCGFDPRGLRAEAAG